jgi:hypothetical protein
MRLLLKLLAIVILGPFALLAAFLIAVAALVAVPMLWEQLVAKLTAPPAPDQSAS